LGRQLYNFDKYDQSGSTGSILRYKAAQVFRIKSFTLFYKVILPESLPTISNGLKLGLSFSLLVEIVAEMFLGATSGLGKLLLDAQLSYKIPELYAILITIGVIT
jgi:NitT/TauT family transport system permease protein